MLDWCLSTDQWLGLSGLFSDQAEWKQPCSTLFSCTVFLPGILECNTKPIPNQLITELHSECAGSKGGWFFFVHFSFLKSFRGLFIHRSCSSGFSPYLFFFLVNCWNFFYKEAKELSFLLWDATKRQVTLGKARKEAVVLRGFCSASGKPLWLLSVQCRAE